MNEMDAPKLKLATAVEKHCYKCNASKPIAEFNKDRSRPDGLNPLCKPCAKAKGAKWNTENPGAAREAYRKWYADPANAKKANQATVARNRERADLLIAQFKTKPCMDCGNTFPTCCMDFDHRLGTEKSFELKYKNFACKPISAIVDELAKCDLVCANCHRIRTVARNQTGRKKG